MQIKYELNENDYWVMNRYMLFHSKLRKTMVMTLILLALFIGWFYLIVKIKSQYSAIFYIITVLILYLLFYLLLKAKTIAASKKQKDICCEHTLEISEIGIIDTTYINENRYIWNGINKISDNDNYIFIFIGEVQAYVIPKRAFNSDADASEFCSKARLYWNRSKNK